MLGTSGGGKSTDSLDRLLVRTVPLSLPPDEREVPPFGERLRLLARVLERDEVPVIASVPGRCRVAD